MNSESLYWVAAVLLVVAAFGAAVWVFPQLPDRIPTHWNAQGHINGYGSRKTVFILPLMMLAALGLFRALPWLSPKQFEVDNFRTTYVRIAFLMIGMFAYFYAAVLWGTLSPPIDMTRAMMGGLFGFMALLGNLMGKVRRNFWIGIRTPWTLADERVWDATHRLAGRVMVVAGLLGVIGAFIGLNMAGLGFFVAALLIPAVYSLIIYKRMNKGGNS